MSESAAFERLLDRLDGVRRNGSKATARCPAHEDRRPSLSITKIEGRVLMYCHGGCAIEAVLDALGLAKRDLFDDLRGTSYHYDDGRTVYRTPGKEFRQAAAPRGVTTFYRLSRVREAVRNGTVIAVVEGEQDVHAMESLGVVATTAPMGAGNFHKVDPSPLYGGKVAVIPDVDEAGQKWVRQVLDALDGKVDSLWFMAPKIGKDAADHVAAGYGLGDFVSIEPPAAPHEEAEPDDSPARDSGARNGGRLRVEVTNDALAADWLRTELGRGDFPPWCRAGAYAAHGRGGLPATGGPRHGRRRSGSSADDHYCWG